MPHLQRLGLFLLFSLLTVTASFSQRLPYRVGATDPASGNCAAAFKGDLYLQTTNPSTKSTKIWTCAQTGASTYAWTVISYPRSYTVATLPAAGNGTGELAQVTDASTAGSCTSGGGVELALCRWSGSAWASIGGGGGGGGSAYFNVLAAGASRPATCAQYDVYVYLGHATLPDGSYSYCTATNTWEDFCVLPAHSNQAPLISDSSTWYAGTASDVKYAFCEDAGSTDSYACDLTPAISGYVTGAHYRFKAATANTGAASINFNSIGPISIKKAAGGITTDPATNDIRAGQWVDIVYDGTNMQMQSLLGNAAAGGGSGTTIYECTPAGANGTAYTCTASPTLSAYATNLQVLFTPDVSSPGTADDGTDVTVDMTSLGATAIKRCDGTQLASVFDILGGQIYRLTYDGTNFRLPCGGAEVLSNKKLVALVDEFHPNLTATNGLRWGLGWSLQHGAGTGTAGASAAVAGHIGIGSIQSATADNDYSMLSINNSQSSEHDWMALGDSSQLSRWQLTVVFRTDANASATDQFLHVGFQSTTTYRDGSGNAIGLRYDSDSATCTAGSNSTTNFILETIAAGSSNCVATAQAEAANTWYTVRLWSVTAGTISAQIAAGAGAWSAVVSSSTHVPTANLWPVILTGTRSAGTSARNIGVDYWEFVGAIAR